VLYRSRTTSAGVVADEWEARDDEETLSGSEADSWWDEPPEDDSARQPGCGITSLNRPVTHPLAILKPVG